MADEMVEGEVALTDSEIVAMRDRYLKGESATVLAMEAHVTLPEVNKIVNDRVDKPIFPRLSQPTILEMNEEIDMVKKELE